MTHTQQRTALPPEAASVEAARPGANENARPAEPEKISSGKRKRLAKAFPRPLDKKVRKSSWVRDTFTFPETDYLCLAALKERLLIGGVKVKKSELLRAGLALLFALDDDALKAQVSTLPQPEEE